MGYDLLLVDCPWAYADSPPRSSAAAHYETIPTDTLCRMQVADLGARDSVLFLWTTGPFMPDALRVMEAWGYSFLTVAFVWAKTRTKNAAKKTLRERLLTSGNWSPYLLEAIEAAAEPVLQATWAFGMGHTTRANAEFVLMGVRGKGLKRCWAGCPALVVSPRLEHSQKPPEVQERLERLYPPETTRLELFARPPVRSGWHVWGDRVECDIRLEVPVA